MKLAYLCHPHAGGTYSVFRNLRSALLPHGVELRWLAGGAAAHAAAAASVWAADLAFGSVVGEPSDDDRGLSLALLHAIEQGGFDGVLINVLTSHAEMNIARYLSPGVVRLMVVHNVTVGTYAAARAIRDHVQATVCVSPRIGRDLVQHHRFDPARTVTILNGVAFPRSATSRAACGGMPRLLYSGRIEDAAKGVFLLPRILNGLDPQIGLTIAGDGPDLPELRSRSAGLGARMHFLGEVSQARLAQLLARHDILLMPSRFEGLGLSLIEAMGAGCVPVVSRLSGVTDTVVTDGQNGCLVAPGSVRAAQRAIGALVADPTALQRMSAAALETARTRFSVATMASHYLTLINSVCAASTTAVALDPSDWRLPSGMRPGLRSLMPVPARSFLRSLRERLAV